MIKIKLVLHIKNKQQKKEHLNCSELAEMQEHKKNKRNKKLLKIMAIMIMKIIWKKMKKRHLRNKKIIIHNIAIPMITFIFIDKFCKYSCIKHLLSIDLLINYCYYIYALVLFD